MWASMLSMEAYVTIIVRTESTIPAMENPTDSFTPSGCGGLGGFA
jgi:hypothetical protein